MSDDNITNLPSQQEIEKDISEYLAKKYGDRVKIVGLHAQPEFEVLQRDDASSIEEKKKPHLDW